MALDDAARPSSPDHRAVLERESARAAEVLAATDPGSDVPACPDWDAADLTYHLAEVQQHWAHVVATAPAEPDVESPERAPDAALPDQLRAATAALLDALDRHEPGDACWSWSPAGGTVAWVLRRQAHEALVHRVDAEQAAGVAPGPIDPALAADGVDEMVTVMLGGLPAWAAFEPGGTRVRLRATDVDREWVLEHGRFTGTSPTSGTVYDEPDVALAAPGSSGRGVAATVTAGAAGLDLWLWGRVGAGAVEITGDTDAVDRLRQVVVASTQ
jgi:uncharacterized protein (TIGR03083 family)